MRRASAAPRSACSVAVGFWPGPPVTLSAIGSHATLGRLTVVLSKLDKPGRAKLSPPNCNGQPRTLGGPCHRWRGHQQARMTSSWPWSITTRKRRAMRMVHSSIPTRVPSFSSQASNDGADYVKAFLAIDWQRPEATDMGATTRYDRKLAAYKACLYRAGFDQTGLKVRFQSSKEIREAPLQRCLHVRFVRLVSRLTASCA